MIRNHRHRTAAPSISGDVPALSRPSLFGD